MRLKRVNPPKSIVINGAIHYTERSGVVGSMDVDISLVPLIDIGNRLDRAKICRPINITLTGLYTLFKTTKREWKV